MEIKIKVAQSKNNNNLYKALVLIDEDTEKEITISFDKQLILKLSGLTYKDFVNMPCGYYDVELY